MFPWLFCLQFRPYRCGYAQYRLHGGGGTMSMYARAFRIPSSAPAILFQREEKIKPTLRIRFHAAWGCVEFVRDNG